MMNEEQEQIQAEADELGQRRRARGCGGVFLMLMLIMAAGWGAGLGAFLWLLNDAKTSISALESFRPKVGSKVYSADGELLGEFSSNEKRQLVSLGQIPIHLQKAFIATEDHTFYQHKGVRPFAILNALKGWAVTGRMRGASTISQQVVRRVDELGVGDDDTIDRKIREALTAMQVERDFTKDEILEIYLNQIFLGKSAFGVQAAALQYFGRNCWDLTLSESAMLAGLARGPNANEPFGHFENARARRDIVLGQMLENGFITQAEYDEALAEKLEESVVTPEKRQELADSGKSLWNPDQFKAPYFVEEVRRAIYSQTSGDRMFIDGLEIHTTLDMRLQRAAEEVLLQALDEFDAKKRAQLKRELKEDELVTGALVCIDNRPGYKGYIRAMVGGRDFDRWKFNNATQAKRQPGSSIKPFVWSAAIASGMTPSTVRSDEPYVKVDSLGPAVEPQNFSGKFEGPVTLRVALQKSINTVSIRLVEELTLPVVRSYLERAGIRTPISNSVGLTVALGTPLVTILDQCTAYSTFANLGIRHDPLMITEVKDRDGLVLPEYDSVFRSKPEKAMDANVAYVMTHLLEGVATYGTGASTKSLERPRAGKTGTSNDSKDVWFCGFTPDYTCVVWLGYPDNRPLGNGRHFTGGSLACPIWTQFMKRAEEGMPVREFEVPKGVEFFDVDRVSGVRGGNFKEAFVAGTHPPSYEHKEAEEEVVAEPEEQLFENL